MPQQRFRVRADAQDFPEPLREGVAQLRNELGVAAEFPPPVVAEAEAAASGVSMPEVDRTDLEFVTIDPEGAKDLDQALFIAREADGYRVFYAIADVAAFVRPGGAIDVEAHQRGQTLYAPSLRTPLHPPVLSEGAASLLPGEDRPAMLWEIALDASGAVTEAKVGRAKVRSREQLTYTGVQKALDDESASDMLKLLREVGKLRQAQEIERGGVSLNAPEQVVVPEGDAWRLEFRQTLPVEDWNAQISLLTGICAATIMLDGGVGILRTLPPAQKRDVERLRHVAKGLGLSWPGDQPYAEFVRALDPAVPQQAAMLNACTRLFGGAGYAAFSGTPPEQPLHAALATPYAHCTAPLRRLVDRYATECCLALTSGREVPTWVTDALDALPAEMDAADKRAKKYERGIVNLVEALVLKDRIGQTFDGIVIEVDSKRGGGVVQIAEPAIEARSVGRLELGASVTVRCVEADVVSGNVKFEAV